MSSLSRACIELSNSIKGFRLSRSADSTTGKDGGGGVNASTTNSVTTTTALTAPTTTSNVKTATSVTSTITRAIKSATSRVRGATTPTEQHKNGHSNLIMMMNSTMSKKWTGENPWEDESFLTKLFMYFSPCERCVLSQVCKKWKEVLYRNHIFWNSLVPVFNCKVWRTDDKGRALFYKSLEERGFNSIIVTGATDIDITEFVNNFPNSRKNIQSIALRCSNVSDAGLENMMEKMIGVNKLELAGCNEVTESAFWACLHSRIISLSISDCINVADDSVSAMAQKLPYLIELTLQAYHVTDASLSLFTAKHTYGLTVLRLISCWEITNQGIFSIVHALPNISVLSVSGCSKITDEGVELITDNLHQLKSLDLSWCPRITDAGLEYIPDLTCLEDLFLDRYGYF